MDWVLLGQAGLHTLRPLNTPLSAAKRLHFLIYHFRYRFENGPAGKG